MKTVFHSLLHLFPDAAGALGSAYSVTSFAGGGDGIAKDGAGTKAGFTSSLNHLTVAADGFIYVADGSNLRKVSPEGEVTTLFGSFIMKEEGDFWQPEKQLPADAYGITTDKKGTVYISLLNHTIGKISPAGELEIIAGTEWNAGNADGDAGAAAFYEPKGIVMDKAGTIFIADPYNGRIRKLSADLKTVSTLTGQQRGDFAAGSATTAVLPQELYGIAADSKGNVYAGINMSRGSCVAKITAAGEVTVLAGDTEEPGHVDGAGKTARFKTITALCCDAQDNIWVAGVNTVRRITPDGNVVTIAGHPDERANRNGDGATARFSYLNGICADAAGNIFVSDMETYSIRKIVKR